VDAEVPPVLPSPQVTPAIHKPKFRIECGDATTMLQKEPDNSIDCVVTSPPYFALRDYHVAGQIGLERTLHHYLNRLMLVMSEVQRVLKPTGTFWLNMGDAYYNPTVGTGGKRKGKKSGDITHHYADIQFESTNIYAPVPRKSLMGVPWRVALAMLDHGWTLRNVAVWAKPNPLPHPVIDRLTASWEPVFLFTKSDRYYFDLDAIRLKQLSGMSTAAWDDLDNRTSFGTEEMGDTPASRTHAIRKRKHAKGYTGNPLGKNPGDVWVISPDTDDDDEHFASFPEFLVSICLKAGCPTEVCEVCKLPPIRGRDGWNWCKCNAGRQPGIVLDPFVGSGTTCAVAAKLGLDSVGIDLNPKDAAHAIERVEEAATARIKLAPTLQESNKPRQLTLLELLDAAPEVKPSDVPSTEAGDHSG